MFDMWNQCLPISRAGAVQNERGMPEVGRQMKATLMMMLLNNLTQSNLQHGFIVINHNRIFRLTLLRGIVQLYGSAHGLRYLTCQICSAIYCHAGFSPKGANSN